MAAVGPPLKDKLGLVLSGGGARAAYQAGVMRAVAEIALKMEPERRELPFKIITGVSAGAINAAYLACNADSSLRATESLLRIWKTLTPDRVIRTEVWRLAKTLLQILRNIVFRKFRRTQELKPPYSILDFDPLRDLLSKGMNFDRMRENLASGLLDALALTATDYSNSNSISFIESKTRKESWIRKRRYGVQARLTIEHVMASASIPILFSPVNLDGRFYGDGSVRNMAPLSPAVHLNANKLLVISVKYPLDLTDLPTEPTAPPSPAKLFSLILNALILDQTDFDMERFQRINATVKWIPQEVNPDLQLRPVEFVWIQPSVDLGKLAIEYAHNLPRVAKLLIKPFGSLEQSAEIISYVLFDKEYCSRLTDIGYGDGMRRRKEIEALLSSDSTSGG